MTSGERLRLKLEPAIPVLASYSERVWCSPNIRTLYPAWLVAMHGVVRSAVPLMNAAIDRARAIEANDPVGAAVADYLSRHVSHEEGHDQWLLEDLEVLGVKSTDVLRRIPLPSVAVLVGAQYYWLHHYHPVSLLGHMAVMEGYPPSAGFADRLQQLTGYPRNAFTSIRRHEHLDVGHGEELFEVIDGLRLTREHEVILGICGLQSIRGLIDVFIDLGQTSELRSDGSSKTSVQPGVAVA